MTLPSIAYKHHGFPPAIIAHAVGLLSLRLVEEMLLERGIVVSYETVRRWVMKFGRDYARSLKRKRASRNDVRPLDEVVITIGARCGLPRARSIASLLLTQTRLSRVRLLSKCRILPQHIGQLLPVPSAIN